MTSADPTRHDMVITRVFDAPVERVWQAWTDPEQVMRWWGPTGFTAPVARMDVREGGDVAGGHALAPGQDLYNTWTYRTVEPGRRLEFVQRFADEAGNQRDPAELGLPAEIPREVLAGSSAGRCVARQLPAPGGEHHGGNAVVCGETGDQTGQESRSAALRAPPSMTAMPKG